MLARTEPHPWNEWVRETTERLRHQHLLRELVPVQPTCSAVETSWPAGHNVREELCTVRSFGLNDYLGLSVHPQVRRAVSDAALQQGSGPRSSALLGGYTALHHQLEAALADLKHTEDALLFSSGFAANMAVLTAFAASPDCAIFSDALNHASIVDGTRLAARSGAEVSIYRHRDSSHLEQLLRSCARPRRLVVTDTLFSMDGDFADLDQLVRLKQRFGFLLVVDDAHGTLVCGPGGGGVASEQGVAEEVDICVGTLSKAFGCHGGFAALSAASKQLLLNRGRSYVYSTALPVPMVAGALAALRVATQQEPWRQAHLAELTQQLCRGLGVQSHSPIVPLLVGSEANALAVSADLLRRGFYVPAVRPPTVPPGTCRLRISLSAAHTTEDVGDLIHAIRLAFEAHDLSLGSAGLMGDSAEMPVTLQSRL